MKKAKTKKKSKKSVRGRPFKKGKSGNPNGAPKLPKDIKEARKLNKDTLELLLNEFLYMSKTDLEKRVKRPGTTVIELIVANFS